ncbi:putative molybdenum cofactor biosynthesis protein [Gordonia effusa NBRC 100432]|uniref:Molybdopterin molybdenumtransferase n=1 Tax=Gordonia effusa NBRC 100432 TaxID=1077974 RepID=H0QYX7_9ACTN|nr:NTP transferase domain-containing protein [Gordonia effusa]GAB18028.1 putative molybdenum cofactor biosynthesis protein [Gordonia effusa NBRC 100432]
MAYPMFAIILAGGRGNRMGGVDKPSLRVGGRALLDVALDAVSDSERIVVVGPPRELDSTILQVREDPPGSGPAPAVAAGLAALDAECVIGDDEIAVLAADVPFLSARDLDKLSRARHAAHAPAAFALDSSGRMQYLVGVWSASALRESLSGATGPAMRALVPAGTLGVTLDDRAVSDVDTAADLDIARHRAKATTRRLTPPRAAAVLRQELSPLPGHSMPPTDALGAALAADVHAAQAFPAFDTSAMDGYAVAGPGPWKLLAANVSAGTEIHPTLLPGQAVRIATGAMLPPGAQRVIRDEEVIIDETTLVATSLDRDDTRRQGSEWSTGDVLVPAGTRVDDAVISVTRSAGTETVDVRGPLRVLVHTTGDEIADTAERPGTIVDTASDAVRNMLRRNGCHVNSGAHLSDSRAAFVAALSNDIADLVVLIGATGRGVADYLRTALDDVDARIIVDGIDIRPGGSLLVAAVPSGPVVVGLGGNPLAAVAGATLLVGPITDRLLGAVARQPELIAVEHLGAAARPGGWRMVPVTPTGTGRWSAPRSIPTAHLHALIGTRGFALIPPGAHDDDLVEYLR